MTAFLYAIGALCVVKGVYVLTMVLALRRTGGALYCITHRAKIATDPIYVYRQSRTENNTGIAA